MFLIVIYHRQRQKNKRHTIKIKTIATKYLINYSTYIYILHVNVLLQLSLFDIHYAISEDKISIEIN